MYTGVPIIMYYKSVFYPTLSDCFSFFAVFVSISMVTCDDDDAYEKDSPESNSPGCFTYRSVILQFHLHHRLEDSILDSVGLVGLPHLVIEVFVQLSSRRRVRCFVEIWLVAFFHIAKQSELGNFRDGISLDNHSPRRKASKGQHNIPHSTSP